MKKIKVAYYTEVDLNANDGPAVNEAEFIRNLTQYNNDNFLFITNEKNLKYCNLNKIENVVFVKNIRLRSFFKIIFYSYIIIKKIESEKVDILVCRLSSMPFLPFLYKFMYKKKKLAIKTAAFWYWDQEKQSHIFGKLYAILNNFLTKKVYQWADIVDTALPNAQNALIERGIVNSKKIQLIENGINVSKFSIEEPKTQIPIIEGCFPVLGFMGSFPSVRGAKQALEVAKKIKKSYPNVAVMILGDDIALKRIIESFKQDGIIVYAPGIVPYHSIEKYVQLMTIGFSFYEPWTVNEYGNASQKVRQYLACGKPVFSTHHNHQFLVENDLGSVFEHDDYISMAESALKWLDKIKNQEGALENRIRKYAVDNLSCEHTFLKRINLYQKILEL